MERWLREIIEKRLRRGVLTSVPDLIRAITEYLEATNTHPKPFVWTAFAQVILTKVRRANEALKALR